LTSNNTRELSEALKRRCLFLHIGYPTIDRERNILEARVPELSAVLAEKVARTVATIRNVPTRKAPSVSETIDWARTLLALGIEDLDDDATGETLNVLLKYQSDIDKVAKELSLEFSEDG
jgi:MoxR-like ATPase